jgi:uncharacterized phiE125 gp8 family phage protein
MKLGNRLTGNTLHSLIPPADFKAILGIDDREDALCRYCLVTATYSIEQYCKRRFLRKKHTDYLTFSGEYIFTLREYPVRKVLHVTITGAETVDPRHYYCLPDEGVFEDLPFSLALRPPLGLPRNEGGIQVRYMAGYSPEQVPADLASACLELAAWNLSRYRGRRFGMNGEQLEVSMPVRVRELLEAYRRRTI